MPSRVLKDSVLLFWGFTLFVVISGITLLNMLIGVLCQATSHSDSNPTQWTEFCAQVVEDNSREHEKQKILVDLKSSLEEAFQAGSFSQLWG